MLSPRQRGNLAKFFFDSAKLVLAINVLAPIVVPDKSHLQVVVAGFFAVMGFVGIGVLLDREAEL